MTEDDKGNLKRWSISPDLTGEPGQAIRQAIRTAMARPDIRNGVIELSTRMGSEDQCSMVFGSCQYPGGLIDADIAYRSYQRLAAQLLSTDQSAVPELLLLLGDQIYVDATAGLSDPAVGSERHVERYLDWLSNDHVQAVLRRIPCYMMLDDHELDNDWQPIDDSHLESKGNAEGNAEGNVEGDVAADADADADVRDSMQAGAGAGAFRAFQFNRHSRDKDHQQLWGPIDGSPLPLFMLDTRLDRQARRSPDFAASALISEDQFTDLTDWLIAQPHDKPKIVTSSAMLVPRHLASTDDPAAAVTLDGWGGYPNTLHRLFEFIAVHDIRHLVFLSGDEHLPVIATAQLQQDQQVKSRFHSIHTSALYAPFPFANTRTEDLLLNDRFDVKPNLICSVTAETFPAEPGFTFLTFDRMDGGWQLNIRFDGSSTGASVQL